MENKNMQMTTNIAMPKILPNNIFKIVNEEHILEILNLNPFKLVTVVFTSKQNDVGSELKKCIVTLAREFANSLFLYVDVDQYTTQQRILIDKIATTYIFFKGMVGAQITGSDVYYIVKSFKTLESQSRHVTQQYLEQLAVVSKQQAQIKQQPVMQQPVMQQQPVMPQQKQTKDHQAGVNDLIEKLSVVQRQKEQKEKKRDKN